MSVKTPFLCNLNLYTIPQFQALNFRFQPLFTLGTGTVQRAKDKKQVSNTSKENYLTRAWSSLVLYVLFLLYLGLGLPCVVLCCVVSCCAVLCCAVLCCAVLCCVVSCRVVALYGTVWHTMVCFVCCFHFIYVWGCLCCVVLRCVSIYYLFIHLWGLFSPTLTLHNSVI